MATTWQPTMLVQCVSLKPWLSYPGCDEPGGCHDLTLGRIYELLGIEAEQERAGEGIHRQKRVVESKSSKSRR